MDASTLIPDIESRASDTAVTIFGRDRIAEPRAHIIIHSGIVTVQVILITRTTTSHIAGGSLSRGRSLVLVRVVELLKSQLLVYQHTQGTTMEK